MPVDENYEQFFLESPEGKGSREYMFLTRMAGELSSSKISNWVIFGLFLGTPLVINFLTGLWCLHENKKLKEEADALKHIANVVAGEGGFLIHKDKNINEGSKIDSNVVIDYLVGKVKSPILVNEITRMFSERNFYVSKFSEQQRKLQQQQPVTFTSFRR